MAPEQPSEHAVTSVEAPHGQLDVHPLLGRAIRGGPWEDQGVATSRRIAEAIDAAAWSEAAALGRYFVDEANVCHRLYRQWITDLRAFLVDRGLTEGELATIEEDIDALLTLPDGTAWDRTRVWREFLGEVDAFVAATESEDVERAAELLDEFVETWRRCHDRDVDHISGMMNEVVQRFGEPAIGPMYDHLLVPWFEARYSQFDVDQHPWVEALTVNMLVAFEAMRGHLCGPGRRGDIEFEDLEDRYVLRFDPCGSGGRITRGDDVEGTPPRMEAPYDWPVTQEPAAWNHGEPGVCVYCAHCIVLTEIMPIDAFGYPVRVVDPPRYRQSGPDGAPAKCSWTMFKDPGAVPEEYYARVGRTRPEAVGSRACGGRPHPAAGSTSGSPDADERRPAGD